ncbi:glycosyl hydrolase family 61-domain-containing protein [Phaeosphaeriaceae sp. PMI808]|nr:glycosyl hydrolase family 61-domain-containing protein [Phaeosphaeriaceae sp. PMI808]
MRTSIAFALAAAKLVAGHATFQSVSIDGKDQGHHFGVQTPANANNPILDVTSSAMVCNGGKPTKDFINVAAGSKITMQWHHNEMNGQFPTGDADEPIAASHKGPVMVYVAKAEGNGVGAVWTKIYEDGLTNGKWAVEKFIADKGAITVTLPNLADGEYLIRPEIIGLHEGNRQGGAQFYNGCAQLKVTGGSVALPSTGTDMTKAYTPTDPGVLANIYGSITSYKIPGPAVWNGASSGSGSGNAPATPPTSTKPSASTTPVPSPVNGGDNSPAQPTKSAAPAPKPSSGAGDGSGSALPETFTIAQFVAWLKQQTGSKARRHARAFSL